MAKQAKKEKSERRFPGQHDNEEVLLVFHQHPLVMRKALIFGLLLILASVVPAYFWPLQSWVWTPVWVTFALVAIGWFYRWIGWYYSIYIFTSERAVEIKQKGFFNRKVTEFGIDKVQNVNYHIKGLQAVMFQYGEITIQTYVGDLIMPQIYKPVPIHSKILKIVHDVQAALPPDL